MADYSQQINIRFFIKTSHRKMKSSSYLIYHIVRNLFLLGFIFIGITATAKETYTCNKAKEALRQSHITQDNFAKTTIEAYRKKIDWNQVRRYNQDLFLTISTLLDDMAKVDVKISLNQAVSCHSNRNAEFYLPREYKAIINPELYNLFDPQKMEAYSTNKPPQYNNVLSAAVQLGLHILIGAAGHYDENYEKTLGLASLTGLFPITSENKPEVKPAEFDELKELLHEIFIEKRNDLTAVTHKKYQIKNPVLLAEGGSSGVSGGGDLQSILIKTYLLQNDFIFRMINKKCQTDPEWNFIDQNLLTAICQEWPTIHDYLRFLFSFNLESSDTVNIVELLISDETGSISIIMPKVALQVWMEMSDQNKFDIVKFMISHIAKSAYAKQSKK